MKSHYQLSNKFELYKVHNVNSSECQGYINKVLMVEPGEQLHLCWLPK